MSLVLAAQHSLNLHLDCHICNGSGIKAKFITAKGPELIWFITNGKSKSKSKSVKDSAYFCYCAYILHIAGYSGFLWVVPTNTGIFLRSLKLCGESRTWQVLLVSKKKIWGNMHFSEIIKLQIGKKLPYIALYFTVF